MKILFVVALMVSACQHTNINKYDCQVTFANMLLVPGVEEPDVALQVSDTIGCRCFFNAIGEFGNEVKAITIDPVDSQLCGGQSLYVEDSSQIQSTVKYIKDFVENGAR